MAGIYSCPVYDADAGPLPPGLITAAGVVSKKRFGALSELAPEAPSEHRGLLRDQLKQILQQQFQDVAMRLSAVQIATALFRAGDPEGVHLFAHTCASKGAELGGLEALAALLENMANGSGDITFECYRRVVDHLILSTDPDFAIKALELLLVHGFTPKQADFASQDAREYFVRQQHFLSLEMAEQLNQELQSAYTGTCGDSLHRGACECELFAMGINCWELRPLTDWPSRTDKYREGAPRGAPVKGDVLALFVGGKAVVGVVLPGNFSPGAPIIVAVEQNELLERLIIGGGRYIAHVLVGPGKVATDRQRLAIFELGRRSTGVPAMQRWLLRPPPELCVRGEPEVPKDGKARLWIKQDVMIKDQRVTDRISIETLGAEWNEDLQPGLREGPLYFDPANPYGVSVYDPIKADGCIVMAMRGESPLAEKARNAALAGAIGVVVMDTSNEDLFMMRRDDVPFEVDFDMGMVTGLHVEVVDDGRVVVVEVDPDSYCSRQVKIGDCVEGLQGPAVNLLTPGLGGSLVNEECAEMLSSTEPLKASVRVSFRTVLSAPTIPATLIRKEAGECLRTTAMEGNVMGEFHIAEPDPSLTHARAARHASKAELLNPTQQEAVRRAFAFNTGAKGGHVSLIQGPPGTGKTTVALQIVSAWLRSDESWELRADETGKPCQYNPMTSEVVRGDAKSLVDSRKILITGFSNIAIDNIALGLQRRGIGPILRVGRGQSVLTADTIEDSMRRHRYWSTLELVRLNGKLSEVIKLEKEMVKELVASAKVLLSTCITAGSEVLAGTRFKRVLFDEATQATEPASLVPLLKGCEQLVLIGDQQQLPPMVYCYTARRMNLHESLFERLVRLRLPHGMLTTQYRMHPALSAFPSEVFYAGALSDGVQASDRTAPSGFKWPRLAAPLCFEGVGGPHECLEERVGTSFRNLKEAHRVAAILHGLLLAGDVQAKEIAVISPYAAQTALLRSAFGDDAEGIQVATVDSYQGVERDVVICSTVRGSAGGGVGFLSDRRRFNVLLTRAKRGLIVVGHQATLLRDPTWRQWLRHCTMQGLFCGQAQPWSVLGADIPVEPAAWIPGMPLEQQPEGSFVLEQPPPPPRLDLDDDERDPDDPNQNIPTGEAGPGCWMAFAGNLWLGGNAASWQKLQLKHAQQQQAAMLLASATKAPRRDLVFVNGQATVLGGVDLEQLQLQVQQQAAAHAAAMLAKGDDKDDDEGEDRGPMGTFGAFARLQAAAYAKMTKPGDAAEKRSDRDDDMDEDRDEEPIAVEPRMVMPPPPVEAPLRFDEVRCPKCKFRNKKSEDACNVCGALLHAPPPPVFQVPPPPEKDEEEFEEEEEADDGERFFGSRNDRLRDSIDNFLDSALGIDEDEGEVAEPEADSKPKLALIKSGVFRDNSLNITITEDGQSFPRTFVAVLDVPVTTENGKTRNDVALGQGRTKKEAEKRCCEQAIQMLGGEEALNKRRRTS